ncbi:34_t:CDS:2 [Paraglomus occultum]|uniref:34_t:CDS:1 n=1 Tax=Paraglomus occultum TaxID=144539 RepID=A0A9N8WLE3_9GLOM|nr:34_t:CDS:2 [Paraglomus occultum]
MTRTPEAMLWIRFENQPNALKYRAKPEDSDIADLACRLIEENKRLKDAAPDNIQFLLNDQLQRPATHLVDIETTATAPLIIRYPLSEKIVIIRCFFQQSLLFEHQFQHSTGIWDQLCALVRENEDQLEEIDKSKIFFCTTGKKHRGQELTNIFELNHFLSRLPADDHEVGASLSVRIKGRKSYSEWKFYDITKTIFGKGFDDLGDFPRFDPDEIPKPTSEICTETVNGFFVEIRRKLKAFRAIDNELVTREFISPFLTTAVECVQKNEPSLLLRAEKPLVGSRGYGPVDFSVEKDGLIIPVTEVKKEQFEQGAAQNLAQLHSMVETLEKKRKLDYTDFEDDHNLPVIAYGIVTNAREWMFLRWAGDSSKPTVQHTPQLPCPFDGDLSRAKAILEKIVGILDSQNIGLNDSSRRMKIKRCRID